MLINTCYFGKSGVELVAAANNQAVEVHLAPKSHRLSDPTIELTSRQAQVASLLAAGLANKEIAAKLKITTRTVKYHVASLFEKFRTTGRVELALKWTSLKKPVE